MKWSKRSCHARPCEAEGIVRRRLRVAIILTTGEVVHRDLGPYLNGPAFDLIRTDEERFREVRAEDGSLALPGGADLCPDVVVWGGLPPTDSASCAA
jgi:hypothetical protein